MSRDHSCTVSTERTWMPSTPRPLMSGSTEPLEHQPTCRRIHGRRTVTRWGRPRRVVTVRPWPRRMSSSAIPSQAGSTRPRGCGQRWPATDPGTRPDRRCGARSPTARTAVVSVRTGRGVHSGVRQLPPPRRHRPCCQDASTRMAQEKVADADEHCGRGAHAAKPVVGWRTCETG